MKDTFRILIATDNHLGFKERDAIRKNDAFDVFEEILNLSQLLNVDFILHGGDLFDHHKPSRPVLYKSMCLLRSYLFGKESSPSYRILNQATRNCIFKFSCAHQEHGFLKVSTPIFAIHGNHGTRCRALSLCTLVRLDDPGGEAFLSALDLLEASSLSSLHKNGALIFCREVISFKFFIFSFAMLISYFGWTDNVDDIHIHPILLEKGTTKLALYGLGNIRDERLQRAFKSEKVCFHEPEFGTHKDYFNLMVIHQNRYKGSFGGVPNTDCIPEYMLPSFLDLVIWGHEHDPIIGAIEHMQANFHIIQPGASVPTSLTAGEALPKHVVLLEIRGDSFRSTFLPLRTVRPFDFAEVLTREIVLEEKGLLTTTEKDVSDCLTREVLERIENNQANWNSQLLHYEETLRNISFSLKITTSVLDNFLEWQSTRDILGIQQTSQEVPLPLIRLRVEHTGFDTVHTQRFGTQFLDQVANPGDILVFFRRRKGYAATPHNTSLPLLEIADFHTEAGKPIQDLIFTLFDDGARELEILPEPDLNIAVQHYVHKTETDAIEQFVATMIKTNQEAIKQSSVPLTVDDIRQFVHQRTETARRCHEPIKDNQEIEQHVSVSQMSSDTGHHEILVTTHPHTDTLQAPLQTEPEMSLSQYPLKTPKRQKTLLLKPLLRDITNKAPLKQPYDDDIEVDGLFHNSDIPSNFTKAGEGQKNTGGTTRVPKRKQTSKSSTQKKKTSSLLTIVEEPLNASVRKCEVNQAKLPTTQHSQEPPPNTNTSRPLRQATPHKKMVCEVARSDTRLHDMDSGSLDRLRDHMKSAPKNEDDDNIDSLLDSLDLFSCDF